MASLARRSQNSAGGLLAPLELTGVVRLRRPSARSPRCCYTTALSLRRRGEQAPLELLGRGRRVARTGEGDSSQARQRAATDLGPPIASAEILARRTIPYALRHSSIMRAIRAGLGMLFRATGTLTILMTGQPGPDRLWRLPNEPRLPVSRGSNRAPPLRSQPDQSRTPAPQDRAITVHHATVRGLHSHPTLQKSTSVILLLGAPAGRHSLSRKMRYLNYTTSPDAPKLRLSHRQFERCGGKIVGAE